MIRRSAVREYATGSLWVLPGASALVALLVGFAVSHIDVSPGSPLAPLAFQGTADDARTLLSNFTATFVYAAAGLYTVGLAVGTRIEDFPRLAVSGALVLMFASLAMVVYFADHLAHSIQVDAIGKRVEHDTLAVVHGRMGVVEETAPAPPPWSVPLTAAKSGYLQTVHPELLLPLATDHHVHIRLRVRVGEHIVAGTTLGWMWTPTPDHPVADPAVFRHALDASVRIGFERTQEQDAAFGIRQLVDMACKGLSPAVNDPYTAVQAVDHLSVIICALAVRPLGDLSLIHISE